MKRSRCLLLGLLALPAGAQSLNYGVRLGVAATDPVRSAAGVSASSGRSIFGPTVGLRLPARVSVDLDLLRRPVNYTSAVGISRSGSMWEFPLMLRYRLRSGPVAPYAAAGVAWNRVGAGPEVARSTVTGTPIAGGLEGCFGPFCLSGEVRYTRWHNDNLSSGGTGLSKRNQLELLVGLTL